jgi:hypothetical protein
VQNIDRSSSSNVSHDDEKDERHANEDTFVSHEQARVQAEDVDAPRSSSQVVVGTCSPRQVDPTGEWNECKQSLTWDDNCSVNLASQGHCTGVFIGTRVSIIPRQGRLCPRVLGLSPEYSHKGMLRTIIIEKLLQMRPVICLPTRGPLQWANFHMGLRAR